MLYQGSKARIGKAIAPIIKHYRPQYGTITEPFCGGLNMTQHLPGIKHCSDKNKYLIAMWEQILDHNWDPPKQWDEAHYKDVRDNRDNYPDHYVGYIGFCSFGGRFFEGFRQPDNHRQNYALEYYNNIMKQKQLLSNVHLSCHNYLETQISTSTVVYCDPPYSGTKEYAVQFDHYQFWEWCRQASTFAPVLISEYNAPKDFRMVWYQSRKSGMRAGDRTEHTEKLYIHESRFTRLFL